MQNHSHRHPLQGVLNPWDVDREGGGGGMGSFHGFVSDRSLSGDNSSPPRGGRGVIVGWAAWGDGGGDGPDGHGRRAPSPFHGQALAMKYMKPPPVVFFLAPSPPVRLFSCLNPRIRFLGVFFKALWSRPTALKAHLADGPSFVPKATCNPIFEVPKPTRFCRCSFTIFIEERELFSPNKITAFKHQHNISLRS